MSGPTKITLNKKDGKEVKRKIKIDECKAVILHPSLACPLIMVKGEPIQILIAADDNFKDAFENSGVVEKEFTKAGNNAHDKSGSGSSNLIRRTIARYLKITAFNNAVKGNDTEADKTIFNLDDALENITVQYITKLKVEKNSGIWAETRYKLDTYKGTYTKYIGDELSQSFHATIHPEAVKLYTNQNLKHIYQIEIYNYEFKGDDSIFDISWITSDSKLKLYDKDLLERQDQYTNEFIKNKKYIKGTELTHAFKIENDFKFEVDKDQPIQNYHPIYLRKDKKPLNIGQLTDVHISSRQHAFSKSNAELVHGTDTNVIGGLVNTSYAALKDLLDQFGEDKKIDVLFFTGDLIDYNRNYHPKKFMDGTLSKTGDIWKEMLFENMNQRNPDGSVKTETIQLKRRPRAGKGNISNKRTVMLPNNDDYPSSIDNVIMYSLFLYYYRTYKKPIFLISGNHECYSMPYGISPRVPSSRGLWKKVSTLSNQSLEKQVEDTRDTLKSDMKAEIKKGTTGGNRANTGVPADHNLTFGEATLMYGPSYHQNIMFGNSDTFNTQNYKPKNIDWFYTVFTPFSDFSFAWGIQHFTGLEWGAGERMVVVWDSQRNSPGFHPIDDMGGILPRATKSITNFQESLVNQMLSSKVLNSSVKRTTCNILLTHFTFANYDQPIPIKNKGVIDIHDKGDQHSHFDFGTFEKNREFVYKMIAENKINYVLSGHSHRSALYQHTKMTEKKAVEKNKKFFSLSPVNVYKRKQFEVDARTASHETKAFDNYLFDNYDRTKAKIIVSASGGSIPIQNYDNELANWGLDVPSGSYIYFKDDGKEEEIGIKKAKVKTAKPRLAVALDFADVIGGEDENIGGFFKRLESIKDDGPIYLDVNPGYKFPDKQWIGEVTFYVYNGAEPMPFTTNINYKGQHKYEINPDKPKDLLKAAKDKKLSFISIKSNGSLNGQVYSQYNQDNPWQFRITLLSRKQKFAKIPDRYKKKSIEGLIIRRHDKFGETPDHRDYSNTFTTEKEYLFNWGTGKKARKKLKKLK